MGDDRYPRNTDPRDNRYNQRQPHDDGRGYGGRDEGYAGARGFRGGDRGDERQGGYQGRDYYGARGSYDQDRQRMGGGGSDYRGDRGSDDRGFGNAGGYRGAGDDGRRNADRDYGRAPQGYQYEERGFFQRAGDEVRSWFGDDDAERRRERDARLDEQGYGQQYGGEHDSHYNDWRRGQMDALDRDYHEYRQENRSRFENEFGAWRTARQGQRDSLSRVTEHQEVVGSDGEHVGTVDKVRDDRIILTKNDADAGGRHHSIPSRWIQSVDTRVTLSKTAQEAKDHWRDEERQGAIGGGSWQDRGASQDRSAPSMGTNGTGETKGSFSGNR